MKRRLVTMEFSTKDPGRVDAILHRVIEILAGDDSGVLEVKMAWLPGMEVGKDEA